MKSGQKWAFLMVIFGICAGLSLAGIRYFAAMKLSRSSKMSADREAEAREKARLEADERDTKSRAAQEAAYTQKYHPDSQGSELKFPIRAMDIVNSKNTALRPQEAKQSPDQQPPDAGEPKKLTREQWGEIMRKRFYALTQQEIQHDFSGTPVPTLEEKPVGLIDKTGDAKKFDSSWQEAQTYKE